MSAARAWMKACKEATWVALVDDEEELPLVARVNEMRFTSVSRPRTAIPVHLGFGNMKHERALQRLTTTPDWTNLTQAEENTFILKKAKPLLLNLLQLIMLDKKLTSSVEETGERMKNSFGYHEQMEEARTWLR